MALEIAGLTVRYGPVAALQKLDLTIPPGELFVLLGGSGSGKTTLLRAIAGFLHPASGRILLDGQDLTPLPPHRRPVNTMFQSYALFPHMSVAANIAFGLRRRGTSRAVVAARVAEMLALVRLDGFGDRRPDALSGGQQQRVALARSLAPNPRLLLLDEPLSALDRGLRADTRAELVRLQRRFGTSFILVTHDQEEALSMAHRIGVMAAGRLAQVGTPAEIYERPATRFVAEFMGAANVLAGELCRDGTFSIPALNLRIRTAWTPAERSWPALGQGHVPAAAADWRDCPAPVSRTDAAAGQGDEAPVSRTDAAAVSGTNELAAGQLGNAAEDRTDEPTLRSPLTRPERPATGRPARDGNLALPRHVAGPPNETPRGEDAIHPGPALLALRPERIRLGRGTNQMGGEIRDMAYAGQSITYVIRLDDGGSMRVTLPLSDGFDPGPVPDRQADYAGLRTRGLHRAAAVKQDRLARQGVATAPAPALRPWNATACAERRPAAQGVGRVPCTAAMLAPSWRSLPRSLRRANGRTKCSSNAENHVSA